MARVLRQYIAPAVHSNVHSQRRSRRTKAARASNRRRLPTPANVETAHGQCRVRGHDDRTAMTAKTYPGGDLLHQQRTAEGALAHRAKDPVPVHGSLSAPRHLPSHECRRRDSVCDPNQLHCHTTTREQAGRALTHCTTSHGAVTPASLLETDGDSRRGVDGDGLLALAVQCGLGVRLIHPTHTTHSGDDTHNATTTRYRAFGYRSVIVNGMLGGWTAATRSYQPVGVHHLAVLQHKGHLGELHRLRRVRRAIQAAIAPDKHSTPASDTTERYGRWSWHASSAAPLPSPPPHLPLTPT